LNIPWDFEKKNIDLEHEFLEVRRIKQDSKNFTSKHPIQLFDKIENKIIIIITL
jgi:hypothetical protein